MGGQVLDRGVRLGWPERYLGQNKRCLQECNLDVASCRHRAASNGGKLAACVPLALAGHRGNHMVPPLVLAKNEVGRGRLPSPNRA